MNHGWALLSPSFLIYRTRGWSSSMVFKLSFSSLRIRTNIEASDLQRCPQASLNETRAADMSSVTLRSPRLCLPSPALGCLHTNGKTGLCGPRGPCGSKALQDHNSPRTCASLGLLVIRQGPLGAQQWSQEMAVGPSGCQGPSSRASAGQLVLAHAAGSL